MRATKLFPPLRLTLFAALLLVFVLLGAPLAVLAAPARPSGDRPNTSYTLAGDADNYGLGATTFNTNYGNNNYAAWLFQTNSGIDSAMALGGISNAPNGIGVFGSGVGPGVQGHSTQGDGVQGFTHGDERSGVYGNNDAMTATLAPGVTGYSSYGQGIYGQGQTGIYALGVVTGVLATGGTFGLYSVGDTGVYGRGVTGVSAQGVFTGVTAIGDHYGVVGTASNNASSGAGILGVAHTFGALGVEGTNDANNGLAIYGIATGSNSIGVEGDSPDFGVFGYGSGSNSYGVFGETDFNNSAAVTGYHLHSGTTVAQPRQKPTVTVYAPSPLPAAGAALDGFVYDARGGGYAVLGENISTAGYGGVFSATNSLGTAIVAGGDAYGIHAFTVSTSTTAYAGYYTTTAGTGLYARSGSGVGVQGSSGSSYGVRAVSSSSYAVLATSTSSVGVRGTSQTYYGFYAGSQSGVGGYAYTASGSTAFRAHNDNTSAGHYGLISDGNVLVNGQLTCTGGCALAAAASTNQGQRLLYADVSTTNVGSDRGTATLQDGRAIVTIDPLFAQTVRLDGGYQVFVTPYSFDGPGLAVGNRTATSFEVRELNGGKGSYNFDWQIEAVRKGFEKQRLDAAPTVPANQPINDGLDSPTPGK